MCGVAAQDRPNHAIQNLQPSALRGYEPELVPSVEYCIGHNAAHGLAEHGFRRPVRGDDVFLGKALEEADQLGSEKWNAAFNRGSHGIAVLVAQETRQGLAEAARQTLPQIPPHGCVVPECRSDSPLSEPKAIEP